MAEYNGWTNRETWLVNVWYGDALEPGEFDSPEALRDWIEEVCGPIPETGLIADMLGGAWDRVNWHELYEHYQENEEDEE